MARCLRCRAGNEWIEGEPAPEDKERVAELERQHIDSQAQLMVERRELLAKLVAAQATISRKDEALKLGLRLCAIADHRDRTADGSIQFGRMLSEFRDTARAALPSDRTALDAMLAEAEKRGMLKATGIADRSADRGATEN